jgi:predicted metal-dependent phosphoesterase TrpH
MKNSTDKYQTLHCHTTTSDGLLTYSEVLSICENNNINTVAFTDHDAVISEANLNLLKKNKSRVRWISGIEISSGLPKEMGRLGSLHIVGLFVNPFNKELEEHCRKAQLARIERMEKMVVNLRGLGFDITKSDCLEASGGEAVGRPHIVQAIKTKKFNLEVMESLKKKMEGVALKDPDVKEKYNQMMKAGENQYFYTLFLAKNSFIKGVYVDYTYRADLDDSVGLIRRAGGLAFLAHWFTYKNKITEDILDKLFAKNRLDGMETVYGVWSGSDSMDKVGLDAEVKVLKSLVKKHDKLESGGVDAHKLEDFKTFVGTKWYAKRTVGMVEKIIEKSKVDITWSSLK